MYIPDLHALQCNTESRLFLRGPGDQHAAVVRLQRLRDARPVVEESKPWGQPPVRGCIRIRLIPALLLPLQLTALGLADHGSESHELLADYRGKSMPHFLFYRNGVQVAVVKGANMPEIESLLDEHAPTSPDADVLEENPMYVQRAEEKAAPRGSEQQQDTPSSE